MVENRPFDDGSYRIDDRKVRLLPICSLRLPSNLFPLVQTGRIVLLGKYEHVYRHKRDPMSSFIRLSNKTWSPGGIRFSRLPTPTSSTSFGYNLLSERMDGEHGLSRRRLVPSWLYPLNRWLRLIKSPYLDQKPLS